MILPVTMACLILKRNQLTMGFSLSDWGLLYVDLVPDMGNRMWGLYKDWILC